MSMNVSPDTVLNDVVAHVVQNPPRLVNAVTFSDEDLPSIGPKHGLAMYIAVACLQKHVPMTLVDDGSNVNVLPLRTTHVLGLDKKDLIQPLKRFEPLMGRFAGKASCQVIGVASSFNLLLGRPWIHGVKAVSSTLHRKIKIPLKGENVTLDATPIVVTGGDLASEVTLNTSNDACGFEVINVIDSCPELENMDLYTGSHVCETILKTGKYFGFSLYPRKEDTLVLKGVVLKGTTFGLGYEPTEQDLEKKRRTVTDRKPYPLTLNGCFVKAGEAKRCLNFPEPLFDEKSKKLVPGIEIFQDCHYIPEDVLSVTPRKAGSTPVEDGNALGLLFGEEREMEKPNEELRKTIKWTDNRGLLFKLTTREGEMLNPDEDSESESESESDKSLRVESKESSVENTPFLVFPFGVPPPSSGIPEPIPNATLIPPLTSDQLAQIDMPGIDREIAGHKIPIKPAFKPIKQKLRRMRTEWSLKVKEEIDKQLKAGFIKVSEYSDWVANVVPVPKKDGKEFEVYVDDMIVKLKERDGHPKALRKFLERLTKYNMRLNPQKCVFGVTFGKLLGHIVSHHGIEIDPLKIKAIMEMPHPKTEKEIRGFLGRIQYISRFVSKLTMICEPIFKKLKVGEHKMWDDECQAAFDRIKEVMSAPPVLGPPIAGLPLSLYLTVTDTAMGAMLAQTVENEERAIYYISKKFLEYEAKYTTLEKICLALVWATKKLRHYMLCYSVSIYSRMDPIKYLFDKPVLNGRMSR
ncbi:uncharacterized protein LOC141590364 [Silene latifolia]|uniref:uncharacterized protein LOC141590364 n=1 Tax=Silene latifolia TaxID=37657 RepID=UPI003D77CED4